MTTKDLKNDTSLRATTLIDTTTITNSDCAQGNKTQILIVANAFNAAAPTIDSKVDKINIIGASYGSATAVPVITVNAQGQVTVAVNTPIAITASQITDFTTSVITPLANKVDKINITGGTAGTASSIPVFVYNAQGQVINNTNTQINITSSQVSDLNTTITTNLNAVKGQPNGIASLGPDGKIFSPQLPTGANFKGTWNASTNTPTLSDSASGNVNGDFYRVSVAGTVNLGSGTITFGIGDEIIFDASVSKWIQVGRADVVISVNGKTGAVVLNTDDIQYPTEGGGSTQLTSTIFTLQQNYGTVSFGLQDLTTVVNNIKTEAYVIEITSNAYTMGINDVYINMLTASSTLTLTSQTNDTRLRWIKNSSTTPLTIQGNGKPIYYQGSTSTNITINSNSSVKLYLSIARTTPTWVSME